MKAKRKFNTGGSCAVKLFLRRSKVVFSSPKTVLALVVLSSLLIVSCKSSSSGNKDTEAVAKVGSHEILMKQVDNVIKQQLDAKGGGTFTPGELVAARLSVLDNLIQEEALFQRAQKDNLVPDDNKVNQAIQKRKQDANLTEDQYQAQIKQAGLTEEEVRDQIRRELAIDALREAQRARVSQPTDAEIEKYYSEHQNELRAERGVDISVIATDPANNGAADDAIGEVQAEQKIKTIYDQLKGGSDFATVASQRSEDSGTAMRAGALGFATEDQLKQIFPTRPELPPRLMSMTSGQFTEPLKDSVANRWYIIKVNQKIEQARNLTLNDVRANIINSITQQRQGVLLNALMLTAVNEAGVKNHLAERIVQNPQTIVEMRPSALLTNSQQPQQPQPRFENQNQAAPASSNSNRASSSNANTGAARANANR
ncbi:MAG: SurA N-terminal domain-containing protein [Blastocatellia bacterium]